MSSSSHVRVLVVGYGHAGAAIIRGLLAPQYKERIAVGVLIRPSSLNSSDAKKTAALNEFKQLGAQLVPGDLDSDLQTLTAVLRGYDTLISAVGGAQLLRQTHLLDAAVIAGVKRFFPSEYGFDVEQVGRGSPVSVLDDKLTVKDAVVKSGIDYTLVASGSFGEFLVSPFFGVNVGAGTVVAPGSVDNRISYTSLADLGIIVAAAVLSAEASKKTIHISSGTVTYREIAAELEKVTGKPVKLSAQPAAELEAEVKANPSNIVARFALLLTQQKGAAWDHKTSWNATHLPQYKTADISQIIRNALAQSAAH